MTAPRNQSRAQVFVHDPDAPENREAETDPYDRDDDPPPPAAPDRWAELREAAEAAIAAETAVERDWSADGMFTYGQTNEAFHDEASPSTVAALLAERDRLAGLVRRLYEARHIAPETVAGTGPCACATHEDARRALAPSEPDR